MILFWDRIIKRINSQCSLLHGRLFDVCVDEKTANPFFTPDVLKSLNFGGVANTQRCIRESRNLTQLGDACFHIFLDSV
jgi:hypothetical protein